MTSARILASMVLLAVLPAMALADPASCQPDVLAGAGGSDEAQLRCDLDRAAMIAEQSERQFGSLPEAWLEIVDTFSPSGAAYVYSVHKQNGWNFLEARSVPGAAGNGNGSVPACRLATTLPGDVSSTVDALIARLEQDPAPAYGPREEVTHNPDGSRSVRLILDSHDIVTRIDLAGGRRHFSRHARSTDDVNRLNELVIGVANVSSAWSCDAS